MRGASARTGARTEHVVALESTVSKLRTIWNGVRDSLWFIPTLLTIGAFVLAFVTVGIDRSGAFGSGRSYALGFLFGLGAEGARGVLSSIASGIITVTGVVFSITIVVLQLASTQFTPRVLRNFTEDRLNQVALGVFIATFVYCLLILRTVRSASDHQPGFTPSISVTVALVLSLVSVALLIAFVSHIASSIQASVILDRTTRDLLGVIEDVYPDACSERPDEDEQRPPPPSGPGTVVRAERSGYLQAVDEDAILKAVQGDRVIVRIEQRIGAFVLEGDPLATAWHEIEAVREKKIRRAFTLGPRRTPYQDVERGLIEIVDIAVKAMSPGINDPTTTSFCLDRLSEVVRALGGRSFAAKRMREDGRVLLIRNVTGFERLVDLAFDPIRHYGAEDPRVASHMLHALAHAAEHIPPCRRAALQRKARETFHSARERAARPADRARIERAAAAANAATRGGRRALGGAVRARRRSRPGCPSPR